MSHIASQEDIQRYKKWMSISTSDKDEMIWNMMDSAFAAAEKETGQTLNRVLGGGTGILEHFIGEGGTFYIPKNQPIISVVSLAIYSETIPASTNWDVAGRWIDGYALKLNGYTYGEGADCYLYSTYGLAEASMPADLRQAIYELTAIKMKGDSHLGQKSTTGVSKETVTYFDNDITPSIKAVFDRYRIERL